MPSSISSIFEIKEHKVECQHIREYARATSNSQEDILHLAVKQYIPLDNLNPQDGDVTIIGAHANGFPKELYEPLWEDLHARSKKSGFRIRSIWIADLAQQGQSGIMNETLLGNDRMLYLLLSSILLSFHFFHIISHINMHISIMERPRSRSPPYDQHLPVLYAHAINRDRTLPRRRKFNAPHLS